MVPPTLRTVEVTGRRTGRVISFPVVVTEYEGERYLVSIFRITPTAPASE